jgi:hypothetical protein
MQTFLHIGLEKTGTTSIQQLLIQNSDALLKTGVLVSKSLHAGNNFYLALASFSSFRPDSLLRGQGVSNQVQLDAYRKRIYSALKAEVAAAKGATKVVLSSEHLQSRLTSVADLEQLKKSLEFAGLSNPKILVYLREPIRIALSHHGMAIKKGIHVDESFFEPDHPRVSQIIGFKKSLLMWQQVFGRDNLMVKLYPEGQKPSALIEDFFSSCQIETKTLTLSSEEKRNANLSLGALEILNVLNSRSKLVAGQVSSKAFFDRLEKHVPGKGLEADSGTIAKFDQHFADSNEWVRGEFFGGQSELFASKLQPGKLEKTQTSDDLVGVVETALELLAERDAELAKFKRLFSPLPAKLKSLLKKKF